jgi:hypothetical protein
VSWSLIDSGAGTVRNTRLGVSAARRGCKTDKPDLNCTERDFKHFFSGLADTDSKFGVGSSTIPVSRGCLFVWASDDEPRRVMRRSRPSRRLGRFRCQQWLRGVFVDPPGQFGATAQDDRRLGARGGNHQSVRPKRQLGACRKIFSIYRFDFLVAVFFGVNVLHSSWVTFATVNARSYLINTFKSFRACDLCKLE